MNDFVSLPPASKRATRSAVEVLESLNYDPLESMVDTHAELKEELRRHKEMREGTRAESKLDGKPRAYHADAHLRTLDQLITVNDKLMRYKYGRVVEAAPDNDKPIPAFIVQLSDGTVVNK